MLIFTRRRDEAIMIGDSIKVTVLRVGQDGVRVGIEAPLEIAVHRQEIYDQIRAENQAAADAAPRAVKLARQVRRWASDAEDGSTKDS